MARLQATLAPAAIEDLRYILRWTQEKFGKAAVDRYRALIRQALRDVASDPNLPASHPRPEFGVEGVRTYHIALSRTHVAGSRVKEPRHFLLYRPRGDGIEVARILHDARDVQRHIPTS